MVPQPSARVQDGVPLHHILLRQTLAGADIRGDAGRQDVPEGQMYLFTKGHAARCKIKIHGEALSE